MGLATILSFRRYDKEILYGNYLVKNKNIGITLTLTVNQMPNTINYAPTENVLEK